MAEAVLQDGKIRLSLPFREKPLIQSVPGARYRDGYWWLPCTYVALTQLQHVFGDSLKLDEQLNNRLMFEGQERDYLKAAGQSDNVDLPYFRQSDMTPRQRVGAWFLTSAMRVCLADGMGAGKTVQACAAMEINRDGMHLVICPNSVKKVWFNHIKDWTTLNPVIVQGSAAKRRELINTAKGHDVLIMSWESVKAHSRLAPYGNIALSDEEREPKELNAIEFTTIICDEAHRLANPKTKQTRAIWSLEGAYRYALTGTPIANHPGDFWSILHFLDPDEWPSRSRYIDRYCDLQWNPWGSMDIVGIKPQRKEEYYDLIDCHFLRRPKNVVMGRCIETVFETRYATLRPKQKKLYDTFKKEQLIVDEGVTLSADNQLTVNRGLLNLAMATVDENGKLTDPSPKVDELMELIEDLQGEQAVIYSASKQLLHLAMRRIEAAGISYEIVTGDTHPELRSVYIERFQAGKAQLFLATTGAAGEGITLDAAKTLIFLQRDYSMIKNLQALDRINRFTQKAESVTIIDIVTEETVDERVHEIFREKVRMLKEITRDEV